MVMRSDSPSANVRVPDGNSVAHSFIKNVILSGVFLDEGEKNGVEGSPDIHR
jgi:hypothetical protein